MILEHKNFEEIKDVILKLDDKYYDLTYSDKWYSRYADTKGKCIVAKTEEGKIVGYLCYAYITKACFDMLKQGMLTGDYSLAPSCYCKNSKQIYLASIVVKKKYRKQGIAREMYDEFLKTIGKTQYIVHFGDKLKASSFSTDLKRKGVPDSQYDIFYREYSEI